MLDGLLRAHRFERIFIEARMGLEKFRVVPSSALVRNDPGLLTQSDPFTKD